MKNVFIDANIWLSLYHFTNDDLEQFSKLERLVGVDIRLFIPDQIYNEVYRNREVKIKDALDRFEKFDLVFPAFCKNYDEYKTFYPKFKELKDSHKEWLKKVREDIVNQNSPADIVLRDFFQSTSIIECDHTIIDRGVLRYNIGNPPGKDRKYGDAINWECLLESVPDHEDLFFISADRDYASAYDDTQFNLFLNREWENKKHSKIIFFKSLVNFLNRHFKDIQLNTEKEKDDLIMGLEGSRSFATTHGLIKELTKYADWSIRQIDDMCGAALWNDQVGWILGDNDVNDFYKALLSNINFDKVANENIAKIRDKLVEIDIDRNGESEE